MEANYGWMIEKDHWAEKHADELSAVGTYGPGNIPEKFVEKLERNKNRRNLDSRTWRFKIYDDDWNLYSTGIFTEDSDDDNSISENGFAPLSDFGEYMYGAVNIKYKNQLNGEWEIL